MSIKTELCNSLDGSFLEKIRIDGHYLSGDGCYEDKAALPCHFNFQTREHGSFRLTKILYFAIEFNPAISISSGEMIYDLHTLGKVRMLPITNNRDEIHIRMKATIDTIHLPVNDEVTSWVNEFSRHPVIDINLCIKHSSRLIKIENGFESSSCMKSRLINYNFSSNRRTPFLYCPVYQTQYFDGLVEESTLTSDVQHPSREKILVCNTIDDFDAITKRYILPDRILDFTSLCEQWGGFWLNDSEDRFENEESIYYNRFIGTWWDEHFWGGTDIHVFNLDLIEYVKEY